MNLENKKILAKLLGWDISDGIPNNYKLPIYDSFSEKVTFTDEPFEWIYWDPDDNLYQFREIWDKLNGKQADYLCKRFGNGSDIVSALFDDLPKVCQVVIKMIKEE